MGYVVFDPASIDDAKHVGELHEKLRSKTGTITERELFRIAEVVGDHTVDLDYRLIEQSNMVVVRYPSVEYKKFIEEKDKVAPAIYVPLSAGVICEMVWGHNKGKKVFAAWLPKNIKPSPFFRYHCKPQPFFTSEDDLLSYLRKNEPPQ